MISFLIGLDIFVILSLFFILLYLLRYRQTSQTIIDQLYMEAITDGLTELYNRRYFHMRISEEMERSKRYGHPLGFLMIDIDHFKDFNDTFGHQKGDDLLRKIGWIIKTGTRKVDIAARYGGEEFAVLLPETDQKGAHVLAERLRRAVEVTFLDPQKKMWVTISIGISSYGGGMDSTYTESRLINEADRALYQAKAAGRNLVKAYGEEEDTAHC
ncbi:MAG: GGDEF domain-containing protein [Candidatus Omnitrophica bacterium]|nr:GGDEF domain-containing protein [Candidatus Omnitrophota bacterium]